MADYTAVSWDCCKILGAKISVFQPNDQIFSLKNFIGFQVTDRAVMRMLIMVLAVLRGVTPTKWDGHAKA